MSKRLPNSANRLDDYPTTIEDRQAKVLKLYRTLNPPKEKAPAKKPVQQISQTVTDDEIISMASRAKNGDKFRRLMDGDVGEYASESEADAALVMMVGFYTQDNSQILRIIERSELWDVKWERSDYQELTITSGLAKLTEFWGSGSTPDEGKKITIVPGTAIASLGPPKFTKECMPPDGFLKDYLNFMSPITEAPPQYHLFAGLTMLATVVGQGVYYVVADEQKYCNLWAVLIGPSGCKKSTSINKPRQLLADCDFKKYLFPVQVTSERLIPMLTENAVGTFFWSEWGATLDQWGKTYAQDIMSIFTALYDGGYFSRWLKNEKYEIENSCINLLCGCTYSWLKKTMQQADIAMGFWPRFLFIPAMKREKYLANPPKGDPELRAKIKTILTYTRDLFTEEYKQEANFQRVDAYIVSDLVKEKMNFEMLMLASPPSVC